MRITLLALLACGGPTPPVLVEGDADTDTDTDTDADTDTDTDTDTDSDVDVPGSFPDFYRALRDEVCPLATGPCEAATEHPLCATSSVPSCEDYDPILGWACLQEGAECVDDQLRLRSRACDVVCLDRRFTFFTGIPDSCRQMLLCDEALAAAAPDVYTAAFGGLEDSAYGEGGTCYQGDANACAAACANANESYEIAAQSFVDEGIIEFVPSECVNP